MPVIKNRYCQGKSYFIMKPDATCKSPELEFYLGDVKEANVQIAPRKDWFCLFSHFTDLVIKDKKAFEVINVIETNSGIEKNNPQLKQLSAGNQVELTIAELKKLYGKEVEDHRILHSTIDKLSLNLTAAQLPLELSNLGIDWDKVNDFIYKPIFNTSYEEVHCVSLNKDQNALHAVVEIKMRYWILWWSMYKRKQRVCGILHGFWFWLEYPRELPRAMFMTYLVQAQKIYTMIFLFR